ncbi:hypothetical protein GBA63_19270 [Rubrobacter tropicus]|uniref:NlpC/P60 domain-containing protein n=1 Tax=Rubrobacter tropicus TaxID=2653851 RepID=A0A6G8QDL1_9ACTN|nr:NlpC/P60 family protein [Rubrobacter tropicus]QIN84543.1 hypothetical protein GBA63_19270 [Rubrobacter tropicus]
MNRCRSSLTSAAVVFAAVLAASVLLFAVPEARSQDTSSGSAPYFQVVDNSDEERFRASGWERRGQNAQAYGEDFVRAGSSAGAAGFKVKIPKTRYYTVYARWPGDGGNLSAARVRVPTASGTKWEEIDQRSDAGLWVSVGVYKMKRGERVVEVEGQDGAVADAVMVAADAMVAPEGRTASYANPDELAGEDPEGKESTAARSGETDAQTRTYANPTRADVVRQAKRHLGTPYRYGGLSACRAFRTEDCSCLTRLVYKQFGRTLPDHPGQQWQGRYGKKIYSKSGLRAGDLVFFDYSRDGQLNDPHDAVAVYAGNGSVIIASSYWGKVARVEMRYLNGFWGGKRLALR